MDNETGECIKTIERFDTFNNYDAWNPPLEKHLELLKIVTPDFEIEGAEALVQFLSQKGYLTILLANGEFAIANVRVTYGTINPISKKIENIYSRYICLNIGEVIENHWNKKIIQIITPEKNIQDDRGEIVKLLRTEVFHTKSLSEFVYRQIDEATGIVSSIFHDFISNDAAKFLFQRTNLKYLNNPHPPELTDEIMEIHTEEEIINTETDILRFLNSICGIDSKIVISQYSNYWDFPENKQSPDELKNEGLIKSMIIYCRLEDILTIDGNIWHINQLVTNRKNIENVIQCDDCLRITDLILLDDATNLDVSKLHCGEISNIKRSKAPITLSFPMPDDR